MPAIDVYQMVIRDLPLNWHVYVRWQGRITDSCTGCNRLPESGEIPTIDVSQMVVQGSPAPAQSAVGYRSVEKIPTIDVCQMVVRDHRLLHRV